MRRSRFAGLSLLTLVAACDTPSAPPAPAASSGPIGTPAAGAATPTVAAPLVDATADTYREQYRKLAESYVALVRADRLDEAYRYLPKGTAVTQAAHAAWWKPLMKDASRIYVGAVAADPFGGDVSLVTPSRLLLLRVVRTPSVAILPTDLHDPAGAVAAATTAADWLPLTPAKSSFLLERETGALTTSPEEIGAPEWQTRMTGVLQDAVVGPAAAPGNIAAVEMTSDRPVPSDDPSVPEKRTMFLRAAKAGIEIVAEREAIGKEVVAQKPPVLLLPAAIRKGAKWSGGTTVIEDFSMPLAFEVLGESTASPDCANGCLQVLGRASVTKPTPAGGSRRAELSIRRWYAKGGGLVREVRQEVVVHAGKSGATEQRTKMTVRSRLAVNRDAVLAHAVRPKEIVQSVPEPRGDEPDSRFFVAPMPGVPSSSGPIADPAARARAIEEARAMADRALDSRLDDMSRRTMGGSATVKYRVEESVGEDGRVKYTPKLDGVTEKATPTPTIFLGSGGE